MKQKLFRDAAVQNLAVADRLDTAVQVVGAGTSLVVLAGCAVLTTALSWSFIGRVPMRVYGEGLLLRDGAIVDVTSMADGQVDRLNVAAGDKVTENEVLATIDQPELKKQRSLLQRKLDELNDKFKQLESLDEKARKQKASVLAQQRAGVTYVLGESEKQLAFYEQKLSADETLLTQGLLTPAAVADTRQKVLDLHDSIYAKQAERGSIAFNAIEASRVLEERKYELATQVSETQRDVEELDKRIDTQSVVRAKATGRVIEVKVANGDAVSRGRAIATLEVAPGGQGALVAELYLPAQDGKRAKAGMPIKLAPSVVKPEEDGYLEGTVDEVSQFPVSEQAMLRTVRNESLVTALLKEGPVYEAHVRVAVDPGTPSGLRWSNGRGPAAQIVSGTPVRGLVTVQSRRPIELVVPAIQRLFTDVPDSALATSAN